MPKSVSGCACFPDQSNARDKIIDIMLTPFLEENTYNSIIHIININDLFSSLYSMGVSLLGHLVTAICSLIIV